MGSSTDLKYEEYQFLYTWKKVEEILRERPEHKLPNAVEASRIDFKNNAIWISDTVNDKPCVVDIQYGPQVTNGGKYGLVLMEK